MKKRKLNYRFHNPNTVEKTADYILKIFMEANMGKVEKAIRQAANQHDLDPVLSEEIGESKCTMIMIPQEAECVV